MSPAIGGSVDIVDGDTGLSIAKADRTEYDTTFNKIILRNVKYPIPQSSIVDKAARRKAEDDLGLAINVICTLLTMMGGSVHVSDVELRQLPAGIKFETVKTLDGVIMKIKEEQ